MTREKIKEQLKPEECVDISSYDDFIGKTLFFRTVTYHCVGKVIHRVGAFLQLENYAWVADSGTFTQAINDGTLSEVEPVDVPAWVNLETVSDMFIWNHGLPLKQKW